MINNNLSEDLLNALTMKYKSDIQSALATLRIYLHNPVGIGEHPQHLEEMDNLVETMASNSDKLETLKKHFSNTP